MAEGVPNVANERMSALFEAAWNDADIGSKLRKMAKDKYADVVLPEEQLSPVLAPIQAQLSEVSASLKALSEDRAAEGKAREERAFQRSFEDKVSHARNLYPNLTEEGLKKAYDRMQETGAYDPEAAFAWVAGQTPAPTPKSLRTPGVQVRANMFGTDTPVENDDYRLLHTNPQAFEDHQIALCMSNPDGYVAETLGA